MSQPRCPRVLHVVITRSDSGWRALPLVVGRADGYEVRACVICGAKLGKLTGTINDPEVPHG